MAWEIWFDSSSDNYGQIGFFCNTSDHSFGPVFMTNTSFDKGQFYEMWEKAGFKDPRSDDDNISTHTYHILNLMDDYKEKIIATMKVSRVDGINAPFPFYEDSIKTWYMSGLGFSPFKPALEALSEDDFDIVNDLIEETNEEMQHEILSNPSPLPEEKKTWREYKGFRVDYSWEVLDD